MIYLMFLLLMIFIFLPIIPIGSFRLPTVLLFFVMYFFRNKKIKLNLIDYKKVFLLSFLFLFLNIISFLISGNYDLKDISYITLIYLVIVLILFFDNIIDEKNLTKFIKIIKIFMFVQLIFMIFQNYNILGTNSLFEKYYFFLQQTNAKKIVDYLEISYRPSGTAGNPIFISIIAYVLAKVLEYYNPKDKKYTYLALIIIILSGARMAFIAFVIAELFLFIVNFKNNKLSNSLLKIFSIIVVFIVGYFSSDFFKYYINKYIFNFDFKTFISENSVSYRLEMFNLFFANIKYWIFGGMSLKELPSYVDNEFILRILQFGIIGFLIMIYPFICLFKKIISKLSLANQNQIVFALIIFLFLMMITSIVMTNIYLMIFIIMSLVMIIKIKEVKYEDNIYDK